MVQNSSENFNWIKMLVVPLAAGLMEAQPVALVSAFVMLRLWGTSADLLLIEILCVVCTWGLYWWALFARQVLRQRKGERQAAWFYAPALFLTFALLLACYHTLFAQPAFLLYTIVQSLYFWLRARSRAERALRGESRTVAFSAGLVVLLAILCCASFFPKSVYSALLLPLLLVLPLFCVSGLVALSLDRLDALHELHKHRFSGAFQTNPTRAWIGTLGGLLGGIVVVGLVLIAPLFQGMVFLFDLLILPLFNLLLTWLTSLGLFAWCTPQCSGLPKGLSIIHPPPPPSEAVVVLPAQVFWIGSLCLCLLVAAVALILVRRMMRQRRLQRESDDEVREQLPVRQTVKARRSKRGEALAGLADLDPASARARYREFLRLMARSRRGEYGRHLDETPAEYQGRLLTSARRGAQRTGEPDRATILNTLTDAYALERYGGQPATADQRAYLGRWLSLLVRRLTGK